MNEPETVTRCVEKRSLYELHPLLLQRLGTLLKSWHRSNLLGTWTQNVLSQRSPPFLLSHQPNTKREKQGMEFCCWAQPLGTCSCDQGTHGPPWGAKRMNVKPLTPSPWALPCTQWCQPCFAWVRDRTILILIQFKQFVNTTELYT